PAAYRQRRRQGHGGRGARAAGSQRRRARACVGAASAANEADAAPHVQSPLTPLYGTSEQPELLTFRHVAARLHPMIRILLAEDQAMLRGALSALLGMEADIEVVGGAGDGETAWRELQRLAPDILVTDIEMPG